jgi:hypothetical protein
VAGTQASIEVIMSHEETFTRLFTDKYKHIKYSLYLFTQDGQSVFQKADEDPIV